MCENTEIPFSKVIGVTKFNTFKVSYEWQIYNLMISGLKTDESIQSALFGPAENSDIKWNLALYPKGHHIENKDYISIFLQFHPTKSITSIEADYEFCIRDKLGQMKYRYNITHHFDKHEDDYGTLQYIKRSHLLKDDNLLPNGCLTLICNIVGSTNCVTLPNSNGDFVNFKACNYCKLQSGYEALFNSQELSDVTFYVAEKELSAHKAILAAHSPVFLAMFQNDMKEKHCGLVYISDVQFDVFQEMLRFIYCGKTDKMSTFVNDLLFLADKYVIQALKDECEKHLSLHLNTDNVIDTLFIADMYHALNLKNYAINFLIMHKNELVRKEVFRLIKKLQPETMEQIIRELILQ